MRALSLERKRSERSGTGFVLVLLDSTRLLKSQGGRQAIEGALLALSRSSRDTDIQGWFKDGATIGVIFTELALDADERSIATALLSKVTMALTSALSLRQMHGISLSLHAFPESWDEDNLANPDESIFDAPLYQHWPDRLPYLAKRLMDVVGSSVALAFCLPLFAGISIAIKLTSKGPVFFCQKRLGQSGRKFTFLKFRSMYVNNDATIHRDYVKRFIANANGCGQTREGQSTYKLTADPRVTPVGSFLRKTSLDELPQLDFARHGLRGLDHGPDVELLNGCIDRRTQHRRDRFLREPWVQSLELPYLTERPPAQIALPRIAQIRLRDPFHAACGVESRGRLMGDSFVLNEAVLACRSDGLLIQTHGFGAPTLDARELCRRQSVLVGEGRRIGFGPFAQLLPMRRQ